MNLEDFLKEIGKNSCEKDTELILLMKKLVKEKGGGQYG